VMRRGNAPHPAQDQQRERGQKCKGDTQPSVFDKEQDRNAHEQQPAVHHAQADLQKKILS
jgi:hypothetical protein